jgi:hypothetical protein
LLRAVIVGFILGFALVGVFRLALPPGAGPQLTSGLALHRGVAMDHVSVQGCAPLARWGVSLI